MNLIFLMFIDKYMYQKNEIHSLNTVNSAILIAMALPNLRSFKFL